MHLVVDSDWAKANPRRAAKIQVEYLLRLARKKCRSSLQGADTTEEDSVHTQRKGLANTAQGL
jgi:phage gp16-like protein